MAARLVEGMIVRADCGRRSTLVLGDRERRYGGHRGGLAFPVCDNDKTPPAVRHAKMLGIQSQFSRLVAKTMEPAQPFVDCLRGEHLCAGEPQGLKRECLSLLGGLQKCLYVGRMAQLTGANT